VQQTRFSDGSRKITHVAEITGIQNDSIAVQEIFVFRQTGRNAQGRVQGRFEAAGNVPVFVKRLQEQGVSVEESLFEARAFS
jgi:hypothetical protein